MSVPCMQALLEFGFRAGSLWCWEQEWEELGICSTAQAQKRSCAACGVKAKLYSRSMSGIPVGAGGGSIRLVLLGKYVLLLGWKARDHKKQLSKLDEGIKYLYSLKKWPEEG